MKARAWISGLLVTATFVACVDKDLLLPPKPHFVRLQLATAVGSAASASYLVVKVSYRRTTGEAIVLVTQTVIANANVQQIPVEVDLTRCLGDDAREGGATTCPLRVSVALRDSTTSIALDSTEVGPVSAGLGMVVEVPGINLVPVLPTVTVALGGPPSAAGVVSRPSGNLLSLSCNPTLLATVSGKGSAQWLGGRYQIRDAVTGAVREGNTNPAWAPATLPPSATPYPQAMNAKYTTGNPADSLRTFDYSVSQDYRVSGFLASPVQTAKYEFRCKLPEDITLSVQAPSDLVGKITIVTNPDGTRDAVRACDYPVTVHATGGGFAVMDTLTWEESEFTGTENSYSGFWTDYADRYGSRVWLDGETRSTTWGRGWYYRYPAGFTGELVAPPGGIYHYHVNYLVSGVRKSADYTLTCR